MDNRYFDNLLGEMAPFIEENGFKSTEKGVYVNDKKSFKIEYNEDKQVYTLCVADVDEEKKIGEYVELSSWLFDDSQNAKDAESVGMDFVDVLKKNMGIKTNTRSNIDIELPTVESDKYTVSTFTKKVLDTYPQLKDTYKNYVSEHGSFLYLNFFGTYLVPLMTQTVNEKNKKSEKMILDLIEPAFLKGDKDSANIAIACLAAVSLTSDDAAQTVKNILKDNSSLSNAVLCFANVLKSNKKLKEVFVK